MCWNIRGSGATAISSDNASGADNQQERPGASRRIRNPQRPYAEHPPVELGAVKIWSDLHGDMQSQAEMTWPTAQHTAAGGNNRVGPYPPCAQEP